MDETEVTNSEYRLFVNYVRDSIARTLLAEAAGDDTNEDGIGDMLLAKKRDDANAYQKYLEAQGDRDGYNDSKN